MPLISVANAGPDTPLSIAGQTARPRGTQAERQPVPSFNWHSPAARPRIAVLRQCYGALIEDPENLRKIGATYAHYTNGLLQATIPEWVEGGVSADGRSRRTSIFGMPIARSKAATPMSYTATMPGLSGVVEILNKLENPVRSRPPTDKATALALAQRDVLKEKILAVIRQLPWPGSDEEYLESITEKARQTAEHAQDLASFVAAGAARDVTNVR